MQFFLVVSIIYFSGYKSVSCNLKIPNWSKVTEDEIRQIGNGHMGIQTISHGIGVLETEESKVRNKIT